MARENAPVKGAAKLDVIELDVDAENIQELLRGLLAVRLSSPERLAHTEGTHGLVGHYDLNMLERDVWIVSMDSGRHLLLALNEAGVVLGYVDYIEAHPLEGVSYLGAVEVAAGRRRQGVGRALVKAVVGRLPPTTPALRARVGRPYDPTAFFAALGFRPTAAEASGTATPSDDPVVWELPLVGQSQG